MSVSHIYHPNHIDLCSRSMTTNVLSTVIFLTNVIQFPVNKTPVSRYSMSGYPIKPSDQLPQSYSFTYEEYTSNATWIGFDETIVQDGLQFNKLGNLVTCQIKHNLIKDYPCKATTLSIGYIPEEYVPKHSISKIITVVDQGFFEIGNIVTSGNIFKIFTQLDMNANHRLITNTNYRCNEINDNDEKMGLPYDVTMSWFI